MCVCLREREPKMKVLDPSDSLSFPSEPPDIGNWFSSYVYESPELDSNDGFEYTEFREEGFDDEEINCENEENLCDFRKSGNENESHSPLDEDDFLIEGNLLNKKTSEEPELMPHKVKYSTLTDARSQEQSLHGEKIVKESVRVNSVRSPATKTDEENSAKKTPGNGFISTRKNKSSKEYDENYRKRSQEGSLKIVKTSSSIVKRKALSDIINIQSTDAALEIAGKWMCPQKTKPNLGPPMKQLRLEQWVRRRA